MPTGNSKPTFGRSRVWAGVASIWRHLAPSRRLGGAASHCPLLPEFSAMAAPEMATSAEVRSAQVARHVRARGWSSMLFPAGAPRLGSGPGCKREGLERMRCYTVLLRDKLGPRNSSAHHFTKESRLLAQAVRSSSARSREVSPPHCSKASAAVRCQLRLGWATSRSPSAWSAWTLLRHRGPPAVWRVTPGSMRNHGLAAAVCGQRHAYVHSRLTCTEISGLWKQFRILGSANRNHTQGGPSWDEIAQRGSNRGSSQPKSGQNAPKSPSIG